MPTPPIVIVAPTLNTALSAQRAMNLPAEKRVVLVTNGGDLTGLRAERNRTFFVDPSRINRDIMVMLEICWKRMSYEKARG